MIPTFSGMIRLFLILLLFPCILPAQDAPVKTKSVNAHLLYLTSMAISPDGKHLVSASEDMNVSLWTFPSMEKTFTYEVHNETVNSVAFSADSKLFISGASDETANVWDVATGAHKLKFGKSPDGSGFGSSDNSIYGVALTADGQRLLTAGGNVLAGRNQVRKYDPQNGELLKAMNLHSNLILSMALHPDGKSVVTSSASMSGDGAVRMNDIETGELVREYASRLGDVRVVVVSKDGNYIAAAADRNVIVWNCKTGATISTLTGHHDKVSGIAFSPDGKYLVSGSFDKEIVVWNYLEGEEVTTINHENEIRCVLFSPDGNSVIGGDGKGKIHFWDFAGFLNSGKKEVKTKTSDHEIQARVRKETVSPFSNLKEAPELVIDNGNHNDYVQSIKYTSDGKEIVSASWDKTIRIWDATTGNLIRNIWVPQYAGIEGQIYAMDVSADKKYIAVAGSSIGQKYDKKTANYIGDYVLLIDFKTGKILDVTTDHQQSIFSVTFSPDSKRLASCAGRLDNKVNIYNLDPATSKLTLSESFSMTTIAQGYFPGCQTVFDAMCEHMVLGVRFSADSKEVYAIDEHGMMARYIPKVAGGNASYTVIGESAGRKNAAVTGKVSEKGIFRSMAMDPKGRYVAAGDGAGKVLIFDAKGNGKAVAGESSEKLLATIPLMKSEIVVALNFDNTGTLLAVGLEGEVRVYEVKLEGATTPVSITKPLVKFLEHKKDVLSAAFSPDGNLIVSSGGDNNVSYVWEARTGKIQFKLAGEKSGSKISRVGVHKTNPFLIGYGNTLFDHARINNFGKIEKAFDLKNLRIVDNVVDSLFATAESDVEQANADRPDFGSWFGQEMISFLPLKDGGSVIGTKSSIFMNDASNLISMTGTRTYGMALARDGETFYTGNSDGQIRIYDTKTLKLIATLNIAVNNEWILYTPDGYYTASKHGAKLVGWLINDGIRNAPKFYPFEQFDLRLNRPDIVLTRLGGYPKKRIELLYSAYQKRLEKLGISETALTNNLNAPVIELDNIAVETTQKTLSFKVKATDKENDLDRLLVYVNDVPLYGSKGMSLRTTPSRSVEKPLMIELTNGQNKIQVSVLNAAGVSSFQETRYINYRGPVVKPNLYVVAIGVSDYVDNNFDLKYAAKDATDISALYNGQVGKFGAVKTKTILDGEATLEKIKEARIFLKESRVDDEVILFIAGHGLLDEKLDFYFATTDVDFNNPAVRGLKYEELEGLIDDVKARKKLMLIDACHSGELDKESVTVSSETTNTSENAAVKSRGFKNLTVNDVGTTNIFELMRMMFADLNKGSGAMVISSASGVEFAFENDVWKNGVFTYSLLEGLRTGNANANKDTDVQVSELRDYVIKRVGELTNGKQTPTSRKENLEFDFKVW